MPSELLYNYIGFDSLRLRSRIAKELQEQGVSFDEALWWSFVMRLVSHPTLELAQPAKNLADSPKFLMVRQSFYACKSLTERFCMFLHVTDPCQCQFKGVWHAISVGPLMPQDLASPEGPVSLLVLSGLRPSSPGVDFFQTLWFPIWKVQNGSERSRSD